MTTIGTNQVPFRERGLKQLYWSSGLDGCGRTSSLSPGVPAGGVLQRWKFRERLFLQETHGVAAWKKRLIDLKCCVRQRELITWAAKTRLNGHLDKETPQTNKFLGFASAALCLFLLLEVKLGRSP